MEFHPRIEAIRQQNGDISKEEFLARHADPSLVLEMRVYDKNNKQLLTRGPSQSGSPNCAKTVCNTFVAEVIKSDRNKDADRITIGRAGDNDVIVLHPSVSKLHAFLRKSPREEAVLISDAGSRFGTTVNGIPVNMGANVKLESGDTVVLARSVTATFFTPADFFEYLRLTKNIL